MTDTPITEPLNKYIFCNNCTNETNHVCRAEHYRDFPNRNPDGSLAFVERLGYRLWICAGCERGTLEKYYIFDVTTEEHMSMVEANYFPERTRLHVKGKSFRKLPNRLNTIYRETLRAFNYELVVLCAVGIRALLEGICADKGITGRNLEAKIDNLVSILPQNVVTHLHDIRFIGNEAAHELVAPTAGELRLAIEVCEDLLSYLYELDYKASQPSISRRSRQPSARGEDDRSSQNGR